MVHTYLHLSGFLIQTAKVYPASLLYLGEFYLETRAIKYK